MAIDVKYFPDIGAGHIAEVHAYLSENATEYFDDFVLSDDGLSIWCYIGDQKALYLTTNDSGLVAGYVVNLVNGTQKGSSTVASSYFRRIIKTSCGLAFAQSAGSTDYPATLFVTKSASGETLIITNASYMVSTSLSFYVVDPTISTTFASNFTPSNAKKSHATVLAPMTCMNTAEGYAPNVYFELYNQYMGTEGVITLNGRQYYTNGYIALAE